MSLLRVEFRCTMHDYKNDKVTLERLNKLSKGTVVIGSVVSLVKTNTFLNYEFEVGWRLKIIMNRLEQEAFVIITTEMLWLNIEITQLP